MKEIGKLIMGIEWGGKLHKEFTLRPAIVRDSIDILEEDPRAETNAHYMGACLLARRLEKLGTIPKEEITPDLVMDMYEIDMNEITQADVRLKQRQETFRDQDENDPAIDPGSHEAGVQPG